MSASDASPPDAGPRPLWQQVLDDLERRIASGDIVDRFPTDRELTEHYGVSRHTVREAVRRLGSRGLVSRVRGRGSVLSGPRLTQPLGALYSLFRAVEEQGFSQHSDVLALRRVRDADAAGRLGLPPRAELVHLERLRHAGDEPLAHDRVWLPLDVGRRLLDVDFTHTSLYDELWARAGVRLTAVDEQIEPLIPDVEQRRLLGIARGEALLRVDRVGRSADGPLEYRVTLIRGQRFVYTSSWRADADAG